MTLTNITNKFGPILEEYITNSQTSFFIFSPFISNSTIQKLTGEKKDITIITSWREDHLLSGVSSLDLYPLCKKQGWKLFINSRLHSKIYSEGLSDGFIGSANCTDKALYSLNGNYECLVYVESFSSETIIELNKIIYDSYLVNDEIYEKYLKWYTEQKHIEIQYGEINIESNKADIFSIYELPALYDPIYMKKYQEDPNYLSKYAKIAEHDIAIYGLDNWDISDNNYLTQVADQFFNHPFIKKIDSFITEKGLYFGEFKEIIQKICTDVPTPYRYELTEFAQNLLNWFTVLDPYQYDVECKRFSQRIYRL